MAWYDANQCPVKKIQSFYLFHLSNTTAPLKVQIHGTSMDVHDLIYVCKLQQKNTI